MAGDRQAASTASPGTGSVPPAGCAAHLEPRGVQRGHEEDGQHRGDRQAAHDRERHRAPEHAARERDHRQHGRRRRQHHGARAVQGRVDDGVPRIAALFHLDPHLVDQDHRVAHDHAAERDDAQDRHEAERGAEHQQRGDDADQAQRRGEEHHRHLREALQLQHQDQQDGEHHHRSHGGQGLVGRVAFFHGAAHVDAVAGGQLRLDVLRAAARSPCVTDTRLLAVLDVGAHGDRHVAVAAPQHRLLELVASPSPPATAARRCRRGCRCSRPSSVSRSRRSLRHGTRHDVDQVLALAQLRQRRAVHHALGDQRFTSAGVRPSARALSWSSSTLSVRTGSFQSSCTSRTFGLEAMTLSRPRGRSRAPSACRGRPRGTAPGSPPRGPISSRVTRTQACGNSLSTEAISRERTRSRASMSLVITMNCA